MTAKGLFQYKDALSQYKNSHDKDRIFITGIHVPISKYSPDNKLCFIPE